MKKIIKKGLLYTVRAIIILSCFSIFMLCKDGIDFYNDLNKKALEKKQSYISPSASNIKNTDNGAEETTNEGVNYDYDKIDKMLDETLNKIEAYEKKGEKATMDYGDSSTHGTVHFYLANEDMTRPDKRIALWLVETQTNESQIIIFDKGATEETCGIPAGTYSYCSIRGGNNLSGKTFKYEGESFVVEKGEGIDVFIKGTTTDGRDYTSNGVDAEKNKEIDKQNDKKAKAAELNDKTGGIAGFVKKNLVDIVLIGGCIGLLLFIQKKKKNDTSDDDETF